MLLFLPTFLVLGYGLSLLLIRRHFRYLFRNSLEQQPVLRNGSHLNVNVFAAIACYRIDDDIWARKALSCVLNTTRTLKFLQQ